MMDHVNDGNLALYSTGDLEATQLELIAGHLADCAECRDRLAEFETLHGVFSSFRIEPTSDDLREFRLRTMRAIQSPQRHRGIWKWAPAAAAVFAVVLLIPGNHTPVAEKHPVRPNFVAVRHAPQLEAHVHVTPVVHSIHHRRAAGLKSVALLTAADHEPTIKIMTADPNVIILLPPDFSPHERTATND